MSNKQTAILLFTRTAREEAECKVFDPSAGCKGNALIAGRLIKHIRRTASKTTCDVHIVDSAKQQGGNFGQRLGNAFEELFDLGYENVIAIGNDSPHLSASLLKRAVQVLQTAKAVAGPASDGGAYLIGMNRSVYNASHFVALPWNSARLYQALTDFIKYQGVKIFELPRLDDIDSPEDFYAFLSSSAASLTSRLLIKQLCSLIKVHKLANFGLMLPDVQQLFYSAGFLRAPPLYKTL